jgi:hypothetical protein
MVDRFNIADIADALERRSFPTVTLWNRIEGRPRTSDFSRALRAEVRDALWMLTRQWQLGELQGEDAGSPAFAQVLVNTTKLTQFKPGNAPDETLTDDLPLEARVEQLPWQTFIAGDPAMLDMRVMVGRRWLKLIAPIADYSALFISRHKIRLPDPTQAADAEICAHPEIWQAFAATAERTMDGFALYQYLTSVVGRHVYDGLAVLDVHKPALDAAGDRFVAFVERTVAQPQGQSNPAWQPRRLEDHFAVTAPTDAGSRTYAASEYYDRSLDWHDVDVAPDAQPTEADTSQDPRTATCRTMIPVPITYAGMPNTRWWALEDGRTNFGEISPDTTDLAKLLFVEFGLVYSNDWFVVPFTTPGGSILSVAGLAVSNVFGERTWIEPAGSGASNTWQNWRMFAINVRGQPPTVVNQDLLILPSAPKVLEGPVLERTVLMRDEMANLVWANEKTVAGLDGGARSGSASAHETRFFYEQLIAATGNAGATPPMQNDAKIRYEIMTTVPENWIPFVPVHVSGSLRSTQLQRGAMTRVIDGDPNPPVPVQPRTWLLRVGLDTSSYQPYYLAEDEVPRTGTIADVRYRRTRWLDGAVLIWRSAAKQTGRGEGSSGLSFDNVVPKQA